MERHGMIKGFVALLDHNKMGLPLTAYVDIALEHPRFEKSFIDDLEKLLAVQECHYLAGDFAYRLKVKASTPGSLADFIQNRLLAIRGVVRARACLSLSSKKDSTLLPLVDEPEKK
jgi:Lrp/AsnC family leucine-responsive transcriptional regulator